MNCNATLTTLTPTDDAAAVLIEDPVYVWNSLQRMGQGVTVTRDGDRLLRDDVTVLTCERSPASAACKRGKHHNGELLWTDDTPGATPHDDQRTHDRYGNKVTLAADPCPDCGGSEWVPCEHPKVPGGCHAQTHPCRSCGDSGTARARQENP